MTFYKYFVLLKEPITSENTRLVAKKIHAHHSIECSAKTGENIDKLFEMAGRAAMAHRRRRHTSRVSKWPFSHCNVLWSNYLQPHHKISQYLVMDRIYIIVSEIAFSSTKNWIYLCARLFQNLKSSFQIHTYILDLSLANNYWCIYWLFGQHLTNLHLFFCFCFLCFEIEKFDLWIINRDTSMRYTC